MSVFFELAKSFETLLTSRSNEHGVFARKHPAVLAHLRALGHIDQSIIELSLRASRAVVEDFEVMLGSAGALPEELEAIRAGRRRIANATVATTSLALEFPGSQMYAVLPMLEVQCLAFYDRAHQLIKLLESFPWYGKVGGRRIIIVRNKLIVHAGESDSNRHEWSFGFVLHEGPQVRPIWFGSAVPSHQDAGYRTNRQEFVQDLYAGLERHGLRLPLPRFTVQESA